MDLDHDRMTARIAALAAVALADPGFDAAHAAAWYSRQGSALDALARSTGQAADAVIGAFAALSPQVSWTEQLAHGPEFIRSGGEASHPGFGRNRDKARRILAGEEPGDVLGGPKVRAFYAALGGDGGAVVVDRHAVRIAVGGELDGSLTARRYRLVADAYKDAALRIGMEPADLQAMTWCYYKHTGQSGGGTAASKMYH